LLHFNPLLPQLRTAAVFTILLFTALQNQKPLYKTKRQSERRLFRPIFIACWVPVTA